MCKKTLQQNRGYHQVPDVTLMGCWAHARRKFDEALKALPDLHKGKK